MGVPSGEADSHFASFSYQAQSWKKTRRAVAKVEWHPGELYPRVGFIVTNLVRPAERVVGYNQRGTAEMDQGGEGRDQVDAAVMPHLRRQRRPPSAPCACLQPR
jgi:DDE family transposase